MILIYNHYQFAVLQQTWPNQHQDVQRSLAQQVHIFGSIFCMRMEQFGLPLKINTYSTWKINRAPVARGIKKK